MKFKSLSLPGLILIEPQMHADERGALMEVYREDLFGPAGLPTSFPREYQSVSQRGVLRGLHMQEEPALGKLMRVSSGEGYMIAVDLRKDSPTFKKWEATTLSAENGNQLYIPEGYAAGMLALTDGTVLHARCTSAYNPAGEVQILWNDPTLAIEWPLSNPVLSERDTDAMTFEAWFAA